MESRGRLYADGDRRGFGALRPTPSNAEAVGLLKAYTVLLVYRDYFDAILGWEWIYACMDNAMGYLVGAGRWRLAEEPALMLSAVRLHEAMCEWKGEPKGVWTRAHTARRLIHVVGRGNNRADLLANSGAEAPDLTEEIVFGVMASVPDDAPSAWEIARKKEFQIWEPKILDPHPAALTRPRGIENDMHDVSAPCRVLIRDSSNR